MPKPLGPEAQDAIQRAVHAAQPVSSTSPLVTLGTLLAGLGAIGSLGIGVFQLVIKNPELEHTVTRTESSVVGISKSVQSLGETYKKEVVAIQQDISELHEAEVQLNALVEARTQQLEALRKMFNSISRAIEDSERPTRIVAGIGAEGQQLLPDARVSGILLTNIEVSRSGRDLVVTAMATSQKDPVDIMIGRSTLQLGVLDGGKRVFVNGYNIGERGWDNYHGSRARLQPDVNLKVQWRVPVPESYDYFQILELFVRNLTTGESGVAKFNTVPVP